MGALVMYAFVILVAIVAGSYYWHQDRMEQKSLKGNSKVQQ